MEPGSDSGYYSLHQSTSGLMMGGSGSRDIFSPPNLAPDPNRGHYQPYPPPPHPSQQQHNGYYQQHEEEYHLPQPHFHHVPRPGPLDQHLAYREPRTTHGSASQWQHRDDASYQSTSFYDAQAYQQAPTNYPQHNIASSTMTASSHFGPRSHRPQSYPVPQYQGYQANSPIQGVNDRLVANDDPYVSALSSVGSPPAGHRHSVSTSTSASSTTVPNTLASPARTMVVGVPNLLDENRAHVAEKVKFRLQVRQQPLAARSCGAGERDRRNIDPPPVVQLHVEGPGLTHEEASNYLRYERYVMHCWIHDRSGHHDESHLPDGYGYQRRLTGAQVATPYYVMDEHGVMGCFFTFPDLSVRTTGHYRLKFSLVMLDLTQSRNMRHFPNLDEVMSDVFEVYTAKEFPGIRQSSPLVKALRSQGCLIGIKKGNDRSRQSRATGARGAAAAAAADDDSDDSSDD